MSRPAVLARGVTHRFDGVVALDQLDLEVGAGEIFGLVGPDGAGKTTTLRLLAAILAPTEGTVTVEGLDAVRQAEVLRSRVGYMAQRFTLYGDLSVRENLDFFGTVFGLSPDDLARRREPLLRFARLEGFQDRRAAHLSGGMKKKLGLACTLVHRPPLLLLDEPTTGVDPISRREFWAILSELHLEGVTIVVATPYMDEAERCTRVAFLAGGRVLVTDTPEAIKAGLRGDPWEVRATPQRRARQILEEAPGVLECRTQGDRLRVYVDPSSGPGHLTEALAGLEVVDVRRTRPTLEDAFVALLREDHRHG